MIAGVREMARLSGPMDPILHRLRPYRPISEADIGILRSLAHRTRLHVGEELGPVVAGGRLQFLIAGWAASQSVLADGRRQIHRLFMPGDIVGVSVQEDAECAIVALTAACLVDATPVQAAARASPASAFTAFIADASREHLRLLNHSIMRLGAMTAYERMSHLLVELAGRTAASGIGDGRRFPLPLTQEVLADALGLSIVHVNRVLQKLRREGLIELRSGVARLPDPEALASASSAETELRAGGSRLPTSMARTAGTLDRAVGGVGRALDPA